MFWLNPIVISGIMGNPIMMFVVIPNRVFLNISNNGVWQKPNDHCLNNSHRVFEYTQRSFSILPIMGYGLIPNVMFLEYKTNSDY